MEINGKKVIDAKKALRIAIEEQDIAKGKTKDPGSCAAARALCRSYDAISARVHIGRTYVEKKDHWVRYDTPKSLRSEIIAFDRGGSFEPGEHKLRAPPSAEQRKTWDIARTEPRKDSRRRHGKGLLAKKRHIVTGVRPSGANY